MAYVTQARIESLIPAPHLTDALDDDGDGMIDSAVLQEILDGASQEVDSILGGAFTVPFVAPVPAACAEAALVFACERVYIRRQADKNPFAEKADAWRKKLEEIAAGKAPIEAGPTSPGAAVTETPAIDDSTR